MGDVTEYDQTKEYVYKFVDFLAVRPLLSEQDTSKSTNVIVDNERKIAVIKHTLADWDAVTYTFNTQPLQLLSIDDPNTGNQWTFKEYAEKYGVRFASVVGRKGTGRDGQFTIRNIKIIENIESEKLQVPEGYGPIVEDTDKTIVAEKIADSLYLLTDASAGRNTILKVSDDGIIVFGAPIGDERSEEVIALIKRDFPGKPINYVYVTHPHSDHIGGLTAYAKAGVPILADPYSIEAITAYPRFQKDIQGFKFRGLVDQEIINGVKFHILENTHAKGQSFAHFMEQEIIYEGDFLEIPFDNTIATYLSDVARGFIEYVRAEKLAIKRIVGHHRNNNISPETMNKLYAANVK